MSLTIMKFGGTSVSSSENRNRAIRHIRRALSCGEQVVCVVSAMGRLGSPYSTDTLRSLIPDDADPVTRDLLMSCGETISACVFSAELTVQGIPALPLTAESAGIRTDSRFGEAQILSVRPENIQNILSQSRIPVITGFQGRTESGLTTTIGRGGSDTSAAVLGGVLGAQVVEIYTDVNGVFRADPRVVPEAEAIQHIGVEDLLTLAYWGASIIHPKAVQAAIRLEIPCLRIRSTFEDSGGTEIWMHSRDSGFIGIASLSGLHVSDDGEYRIGATRYSRSDAGKQTALTVLCRGGDRLKSAIDLFPVPPDLLNEELAQFVVPRESERDALRELYSLFTR